MRIHQAMLGACVAAALVFGAGASPAKEAPAASAAQLWAGPVHVIRDQVLSAVLDAAGEIKARIRQF